MKVCLFKLKRITLKTILSIYYNNCRYGVHIKVTNDFAALHVSNNTLSVLRQHLNSFGDWSLVG